MEKWTERIDKTTHDFIESFGELDNEQLNWKPDPETWSIAQNIDHLIVVNESYFQIFDEIKRGTYKTPFTSKINFLVSFFGNTILKAVQPDRKKKMKTFSVWNPANSEIKKGILDRFKQNQDELKDLILNSKDLVENGAVISSPANKYLVYKVETAFEIIVTHEQRHYEQAKEVYLEI